MRLPLLLCLLIVISVFSKTYSQIENHADDFILPLDFDPVLTGGFGEPRLRHFHMGIDFRTYHNGRPVYSVADGYVSRISVSPYGYGHALYIKHDNGFKSVYAHLQNYNTEIDEFVKNLQYSIKSFEFDSVLCKSLFPVKQGDIVAYSGNTGFSQGPHLHFEIRDGDNTLSYNLLNTVYHVPDNVRPAVNGIVFYPLDNNSTVNGNNRKLYRRLNRQSPGRYSLQGEIRIGGLAGIGIDYVDRMTGTHNRYGARDLKFYFDDELIYHSSINKLPFSYQVKKNSVFDYYYLLNGSKHVHRAYREPNNSMSIFKTLVNDGMFKTVKDSIHKLEIQVIDYYDNKSVISLNVKGEESISSNNNDSDNLLSYYDYHLLVFDDCRVEIDSASFFKYEDISIKKIGESKYSSKYKIGRDEIALKKPFLIYLKLSYEARKNKDKLYLECTHNNRSMILDSHIYYNTLFARSRVFGEFEVKIDTVPPRIRPVNISNGANMHGRNFIEFRIEDELTGIDSYNLYINDKWVLAKYEPKENQIRYYFDDRINSGGNNHNLRFEVSDKVGNLSVFECEFIY